MKRNQKFVILGLLSTVAFLAALLLVSYRRDAALAQEGVPIAGPPSMLAVTGACGIGSEVGVLYVIDTEKKQLAVYGAFQGRAIEFIAARKIFYDLELLDYNDATPKAFSVRHLGAAFEKHKKDKSGESKQPRRRR